jgi:hypothetical protein
MEECTGTIGPKDLRVKEEFAGLYNREVRANIADKISKEDVYCAVADSPSRLTQIPSKHEARGSVSGRTCWKSLVASLAQPLFSPLRSPCRGRVETLLTNIPGFLEKLQDKRFVLADFDITQDYAGIFNKRECEQYLQQTHSFYLEGSLKTAWRDQTRKPLSLATTPVSASIVLPGSTKTHARRSTTSSSAK